MTQTLWSMNTTIENLLNAVEHYSSEITDAEYQDMLLILRGLHDKTMEGLEAEKRERMRQIREDETVARRLLNLDESRSHIDAPFVQYNESQLVGNIMYYSKTQTYDPNILYHRLRNDGRHTIRNPRTGIYVVADGKIGLKLLNKYGHTYSDFTANIPN